MLPIPEIGQLVHARGRAFVVAEIQPQGLSGDVTQPAQPPMHLLKLSSVEDDAFGEEMDLFWELEPGATVQERTAALPEPAGFDPPPVLAAFLNAVRWGAISQADDKALQSPFRSGIEIDDYQLDPVVRALTMPRVNLLIADDVGLGKTIEAGLIARVLLRAGINLKLIAYGDAHAGHVSAEPAPEGMDVVKPSTAPKNHPFYRVRINSNHVPNVQFATLPNGS